MTLPRSSGFTRTSRTLPRRSARLRTRTSSGYWTMPRTRCSRASSSTSGLSPCVGGRLVGGGARVLVGRRSGGVLGLSRRGRRVLGLGRRGRRVLGLGRRGGRVLDRGCLGLGGHGRRVLGLGRRGGRVLDRGCLGLG